MAIPITAPPDSTTDTISLRFTYIPADEAAAYQAHPRQPMSMATAAILWTAILIGWILAIIGSYDPRLFQLPRPTSLSLLTQEIVLVGWATCLIWFPLLVFAGMFILRGRAAAKTRRLRFHHLQSLGEVHCVLTPGSVRVATDFDTSEFKMDGFIRRVETREIFLCTQSLATQVILPKRAFSPAQLATLQTWWLNPAVPATPLPDPRVIPGALVFTSTVRKSDYILANRMHPFVAARRRVLAILVMCASGVTFLQYLLAIATLVIHHQPVPSPFSAEGLDFHSILLLAVFILFIPRALQSYAETIAWRKQRHIFDRPHLVAVHPAGVACVTGPAYYDRKWNSFTGALFRPDLIALTLSNLTMIMLPTRDIPADAAPAITALLRTNITHTRGFPVTPPPS